MASHYEGRIRKNLDVTIQRAKGRDGKFYEILKSYGFFDVNDETNGLTPEQRAQVSEENQERMSAFGNAVADMFDYILGDDNDGMMTVHQEDIIKKLDVRSSMNKSAGDSMAKSTKMMAAATALGTSPSPVAAAAANTALTIIQSTAPIIAQLQEYFTAWAMGIPPLNLDLIPPLNFGFPDIDLLGALPNLYLPGFFGPDWLFIWNQEFSRGEFFVPSNSVETGLMIGTSVDVSEGNELLLSELFSVAGANKKFQPVGMIGGGVSTEDFEIIKAAGRVSNPAEFLKKNEKGEYENDGADYIEEEYVDAIREFKLSMMQQMSLFFQNFNKKYWNPMKNPNHWVYGHWGALANNSLPEYVRTAVCSYVVSTGMALVQEKSEEAALISYLLTTGLYYLIGHPHQVKVNGIEGVDKEFDSVSRQTSSFTGQKTVILPKDRAIAKKYFTWIADIISRLTYSSSLGEEEVQRLRARRIAEANLIYEGVGLPQIKYGKAVSSFPGEHLEGEEDGAGLLGRKFDKLIEMTSPENEEGGFFRYGNSGQAGGNTDGLRRQIPTAKINTPEGRENIKDFLSDDSKNIIKTIFDKAGITGMTMSNGMRSVTDQTRIMFNNLQDGIDVTYKQPGEIVKRIYYDMKLAAGYSGKVPEADVDVVNSIKQAMEVGIQKYDDGRGISAHCGDPNIIQVIDFSPYSMNYVGKFDKEKNDGEKIILRRETEQKLRKELEKAKEAKWINDYIYSPPKFQSDPVLHIEIWQKGSGRNPNLPFDVAANDNLPEVEFTVSNANLHEGKEAWLACFIDDFMRKKRIGEESKGRINYER